MARDTEVPSSSKRKKQSSGENHLEIPQAPPENIHTNSRKSPLKRVFSEEDEIHLLNAFLQITKKSPSPTTAAASLFRRVGKSLSGEINHTQLIEKLRKLRQIYSKQVHNQAWIRTPHERDVFEISHKIWGGFSLHKNSNGSAKARRSVVKKGKKLKALDDIKKANGSTLPAVEFDLKKNYSILVEEISRLPGNLAMKEGLKLLSDSELKRLNELWRLQQIDEAKILAKRAELIQEQNNLVLDAFVKPRDD